MKKNILFYFILLCIGFVDAGQGQSKPAFPPCEVCDKQHLVIGKIIVIPGRGVMDRYCYLKKFTTKQPWMTPQDRVPYDQARDEHNHEAELLFYKMYASGILVIIGFKIICMYL